MGINLPLPRDTTEILKNNVEKISNFGLLFDKYVFSWSKEWKMEAEKKDFLKKLQNMAFNNTSKKENTVHYDRQRKICDSFKESGWFGESFKLQTQSRLIIGLGGTNVLETGMTLHPLYGFPYIPASGLKGLARAYAEITELLSSQEIRDIFGSEDKDPRHVSNNRQGKVVFMDGLPNGFPKIDLDIMNPHYTEYYQGEKDSTDRLIPPGDYLNPVPIFFIAVSAGQTFSFALISRDKECFEKGKECLIGGLTQLGAGGKTNVGYGYFQHPPKQPTPKSLESEIKQQPSEFEKKTFRDVILSYAPGNRSLSTTVEGKKAFIDHIDDKFIPEELWPKLKKDKKIKGSIVVEPMGNAFKIVEFIKQE